MTDRAINFQEVVESIRTFVDEEPAGDRIATAEDSAPVEVCRALYDHAEERDDPTEWEFYMSLTARRAMERQITGDEYEISSEAYLYRLIRTDVSMPDRTVLFIRPEAVALDGSVVDPDAVAVGTIVDDE